MKITSTFGTVHEVDKNNFLRDGVLVAIDLYKIIINDSKWFIDTISKSAGFPLLMGVRWEIQGYKDAMLFLQVWGNVSAFLEAVEETRWDRPFSEHEREFNEQRRYG